MNPIVKTIVEERRRQQITQETLAEMAGISRRTLQDIERGGDTTLGTLDGLCMALGLELSVAHKKFAPPTLDDLVEENRALFARQR